MPTISYIIPVYNRPQNVALLLDCLHRQTHIPEQIIVIDDASDKEFSEQQKQLCEKYNVEYYYNPMPLLNDKTYAPKILRLSESFDIGLGFAKQEICAFVSCDMIFDNIYIERCSNLIAQYENMVMCHVSLRLLSAKNIDMDIPLFDQALGCNDIQFVTNIPTLEPGCFDISSERIVLPKFNLLSYSDAPKPINMWAHYFDGNVWTNTYNANIVGWDRNVTSWSYDDPEFGMNCLSKGLSLVLLGDIYSYHIAHDSTPELCMPAQRLATQRYLYAKPYNTFSFVPQYNELIKKGI